MALISILSSTDPIHRSRFTNAKLTMTTASQVMEGELGEIVYRQAGPTHIPRMGSTTGEIIWMLEGGSVAQNEKLTALLHSLNNEWPSDSNEYMLLYQKAEALIHGEFVLAIIAKNPERILVLNDRFGRLPLYIGKEEESLMVTRQLFHLHQTFHVFPPDNPARAFYLMMGFPPGEATLWHNVKRVMPGSVISISQNILTIESVADALHINPDPRLNPRDVVEMITAQLDQVINNGNTGEIILSMSGGLDSRLLAAALSKNRLPFRMISYADADLSAANDIRAASQVATALELPLEVITLNRPSEADFKELHFLKRGMNYSGMAFILPYLRQLPRDARILTGDGGDKLLAPLNTLPPIHSIRQLARYIIRRHSLMSLRQAASLTNVSQELITTQLETLLLSSYKTGFQQTYDDFLLRQRAYKWLFEGEDRNRWFINHQAPLWSPELAMLLLQVPEDIKANYKLFSEVLLHYNPALAHITNANWNLPVTNTKAISRLLKRQQYKYTRLLNPIVQLIQKSTAQKTPNIPPCLLNWYNDSKGEFQSMWKTEKLSIENLYYIRSLMDNE